MNWFTILIPILTQLFENCPQSNAKKARNIKRNGPLVQARMRRALRRDGLRGKRLRKALQTAAQDIEAASLEEIERFIEDLQEGDD